jgi:zinc protease
MKQPWHPLVLAALLGMIAAPVHARPRAGRFAGNSPSHDGRAPRHGRHMAVSRAILPPIRPIALAACPTVRYILRHNETPKGEVIVRMRFDVGSLDEGEKERGFAHFVEHMAFQGSTHVAQGEMVRLLERKGLAFGAHTNAFTTYETTTYHLDLPRNTPDLIDTALMLMRETASELTISPDSVSSERGVILSEKRDRNSWQYREAQDRFAFADPMPVMCNAARSAPTKRWRRHGRGSARILAPQLRAGKGRSGHGGRFRRGQGRSRHSRQIHRLGRIAHRPATLRRAD